MATNSAWCMASTTTPNPPPCASCRPARMSPTRPSTSRRTGWSRPSSPNAAPAPPAVKACLPCTRRKPVADRRDDLIATARAMQPGRSEQGHLGQRQPAPRRRLLHHADRHALRPAGRRRHPAHGADGSPVGAASRRRNGASTATCTPPARQSAPCCTPIHPSPSAWPACAAIFRLSIT